MVVPSTPSLRDHDDSLIVVLRFDVIRRRAGEMLGLAEADVKNYHLADLFGLSTKSISRFLHHQFEPGLDTALRISNILELPVEDITERAPRAGVR